MDYVKTKLVILLLLCVMKCGDTVFPLEAFTIIPPRDPIPERCYMKPDLLSNQCCILPPFFKRNVSVACGGHARVHGVYNDTGVVLLRRMAFTGCNHWRCILKRYGLINPDDMNEVVDDVKYFLYLDQWGKYNKVEQDCLAQTPSSQLIQTNLQEEQGQYLQSQLSCGFPQVFDKILWDAKVTCKQLNRMSFPLNACTFFGFQSCIRHYITINCPSVLDTPTCRQWKAFYVECHKWYDTKRK